MNFSVADRRVWKIAGRLDVAVAILFGFFVTSAQAAEPAAVDFNRDIRPILSDNCFECHGPDAEQRQAELRLDTKEGLFRKDDKHQNVVAGQAEGSELFRRMTSTDPDERMPPADSGRKLSQEQIGIVKKWIESGAEWQQHWSFVTPTRPKQPEVSAADWVKNPIDAFILARLDQEELKPSEAADRRTLLRRVSFDLTGLPPTPAEVQAFLDADSSQAYERVVDRLLKSPRYAERMAVRWLDAARYADTSGYQSDGPRDMWRWRDWVLEAFDRNMPFDEFTIEQLAGDLLPHATLDQKIATGFNRNHRGNAEGGIVPEEFQIEYVVDRVDTTFTVWQGLTMGCARCHSHKFDPISQKEYYQIFSCFNNIPESGRALKEGNSPPYIKAPTRKQEEQAELLGQEYRMAIRKSAQIGQKRLAAFSAWRSGDWKRHRDEIPVDWDITLGLHARAEQEPSLNILTVDADSGRLESGNAKVQGQLEFVEGRQGKAAKLNGNGFVEIPQGGKFGYFDSFSIGAHIFMPEFHAGTVVSKMELVDRGAGYNLHITDQGKVQLNLVKRWLDDSLRVESIDAIPTGRWVHVLVTYDGTRTSDSIDIYIDGKWVEHKANLDSINQSFDSDEPVRIGAGNSNFHGLIDDVRIYDRVLESIEVPAIAEPRGISELLEAPKDKRSTLWLKKLHYYFSHEGGPEWLVAAVRDEETATNRLTRFDRSLPTVMVMQEIETPRETHVLMRGQYDRPGERVEFGVPAALTPLPDDAPQNRLGLARWLVSRDNPLTARVTVNRFWRDIFGTGIVKTTEDFGVQGEQPSHPKLLDWLAVEFMESGWDVRHILKTIVMSATYQQSSRLTPELLARDPTNRLVARGPRFRLTAEMIRDQALFVSGLLTEKFGGPSVKPYQPEGLWKEIATDTVYDRSTGPDLYRRSLYTYWKRTVAPPMMSSFDASAREMCEVRQSRTNTPLQALNLLNDVTFVEAARVLAERCLSVATSDEQRLNVAFQFALSRPVTDLEQAILLKSLQRYRQQFKSDHSAAKKLIATGESPLPANVAPVELAAWTNVCSTILNLDECVTKE